MSFQSFSRYIGRNNEKRVNLPSIELIRQFNSICQDSESTYDVKNHILIVRNYDEFSRILALKYNRSVQSYERQLKMLGFKKRKELIQIEDNQQNEQMKNPDSEPQTKLFIKYIWSGKRDALINQYLSESQTHLMDILTRANKLKEEIIEKRRKLDSTIEELMFSKIIGSSHDENLLREVNSVIHQTKQTVNNSHKGCQQIIGSISSNLSNELNLYRLLIYKQKDGEEQKLMN